MDILKILFHVGKALMLLGPLIVAALLLARLQNGQKKICRILSLVSGLGAGGLFYTVALFTRSNIPWAQLLFGPKSAAKTPLHLAFPNMFEALTGSNAHTNAAFLQLWNEQFSSFWTEVLNPFKMPVFNTFAQIAAVPNHNGVVFFAVLLAVGALSILIAHFATKSGLRQLQSIGVCFFLGWYFAGLDFWLGPLVGIAIMLGVLIFALSVMPPIQYVRVLE